MLSIDSPSVAEGDSGSATLTFTVSLDAASGRQVTVGYAEGTGGTATAGTDYTALTAGTLTFTAGETSKTVAVSVTGDTLNEPNETVAVKLSNAANASISTATGTGTITDDDGEPALSIDSPGVAEGDSGSTSLIFTVSLDAASGKQVTVGYADAGTGTAISGTDYTALSSGTLTFAAGETSKTVTVSVTGDTRDESDETVLVSLSSAVNATVGTATGTGTITDDDREPALSINSPSVAEGDGGSTTLTFTVSLDAASGKQVTVEYAEGTGGTATAGTDYTALASGTLTFAAGETSKTVAVSVTGDTLNEPDETVVVSLSGAVNATVGTARGTGTITDDDGAPSLSIDSPSVAEGDSGSVNLTFTVGLDAASGKQVTVEYAEGTGGTATAGTDYTALTGGTLTFAAGETSKTVAVTVTGDTLDESDETVLVSLSGAVNATVGTARGTGTITDDDGEPSLSIDSPSVAEGDGGSTSLTFTVSLDAASGRQVTVGYAEGTGGTAAAGTDYTALTGGTLTFAAGETSKTVAVSVTGDTRDESDETVLVSLSGATNASISTATGTGTITDDDGEPSLSIDSPSVAEGDSSSTTLTFTVSLDAASGRQVTVEYAEGMGSTAAAGTDYTALSAGTLTFAAGETSKTVAVSVTGDNLDEPDETVVVKLTGAVNATVGTATGTGTITDDDGEPALSIDSPSVAEGDSGSKNLTFTVDLDAASGKQVTVGYAEGTGSTATAGTDYTALSSGMLTFAAGETSKAVAVTVTGDTLNEPNETVVVKLSNATNASISMATGTGTITDDDGEPSLSIDSPSIAEGDSGSTTLTFTMSLDAVSGKQVTVNYADAGTGTATSGTDYTALAGGTLTFVAGETSKTVAVTVPGDTLDESDETVLVSLSGAVNATVGTATGTGTITDDDGEPSLSIDSPSVAEGDSGSVNLTFTVSLDAVSGKQVTVDYADAGTGAAAAGTDYTALASGMLTFAAGETSKTVAVTVTGDTLDELDETVVVSLSGAVNATVGTATGTGTITDDDGAPSLSIDSPSVAEGDSGSTTLTFTVSLSPASGKRVTVRYAEGTGGTATAGTDYTALAAGTLTFAAGETSKTVAVTVTGDTTDEPHETVKVVLSGPVNATVGTAAGTGTITDDDAAPSVTLVLSSSSISENGGQATVTATLSHPSSAATTVTVTEVPGYYTVGADAEITIAAGDTTNALDAVTLTAVDNGTDEPDRSTRVTGTAANSQGAGSVSGATLTLTDNDGKPTVTLAVAETAIDEAGGTTTVTATLSHPSSAATTVTVTALAGAYTVDSTNATIVIAAGATAAASDTASITAVNDAVDNGAGRAVQVTGRADNSQGIGPVTGAALTLRDDEARSVVTLTLSSSSISEKNGSSTVTATLRPASSAATTITVSAVAGTNAASGDFALSPHKTLSIAAGATTSTGAVAINAVDNAATAANKAVTVSGTAQNANGVTAPTNVTLTITEDDPTAAAGEDQTVTEGTVATLDGRGSSDPDGDTLSYSWRQSGGNPRVTLTNASTATPTFVAPELTGNTTLTFELTVTAGGGSATDTVAVRIQADNDSPTASAGDDQTVAEGMAVTLAGSGTDPEEEQLSYAWTQTGSGPSVTLTAATTATPTFTAPELTAAATLTFELTVTAGGASATDTVAIMVRADNDPPTANAGSDQTVSEGTAVTLAGSGTDPEEEPVSYAWRQSGSNPTVTLTNATTATPTFTAPELTADATLMFELTVTAGGASVTDTVAIMVQADNDPPTANAGDDQTVAEGTAVTLAGSGTDPEDAVLAYAWTQTGSGPSVTLTAATTATPTFTAPELTSDATLTFRLTVTAGGGSATDAVAVLIQADNDPPTANAGSDQTVAEGTAVTLAGSGSDPEDAALSYSWRQSGGSPQVTLTGASTATATFTVPELTAATTLTFELTVTAGGASATDAVAVLIQADNDPPTANAGDDQTVTEGTTVTLAGSGTDPEDEPLSYLWRQSGGNPSVTLTGASTATAMFTVPELTGNATLTFELTVTAGGASATDAVAVLIQADNDPPTANAGADQTVAEGTAVTLAGSGSDPEDAVLSYSWRQSGGNPLVTLTGASTATAMFTVPELTGDGTLTFELTVTAGGASATDTVAVTVQADNDAPTANAGADQTVAEGTAVTLAGSGTDPEEEQLSYAWTQTGSGPSVTLTAANTATPTFTAPELTAAATLTFELTVTAGGASATDTVAIMVQADNDSPTANAGADQTVAEGTAVTLAGSGTDPEDAVLAYAWTQTGSGPSVTLTGANTAMPTFMAPELPADVTLTFTLTVTAGGGSASDAVAVLIQADNDPPTANAGADQTVTEGTAVTLAGSGTPEEEPLSYSWRQSGGNPTVTLTGATTATPTFTAPELTGDGTLTFELTVTAGGASATDTVTITVLTRSLGGVESGPTFGDVTIADQTWTQHMEIPGFTLPTATGGTGPVTYDLSPALPDGVIRDADTHEVTGTPTVAQGETTYTWTATDANGGTADLPFTITVLTRSHGGAESEPTFGDATIADQTWTQHAEIPAFTLPTATGGTGTVSYDLSPALPDGVIRDAATHEVTGTPTVAQGETTYTWTATDEAGATAPLPFTIVVAADLQPVFEEEVEAQRYRVGTAVSLTLPAATGGDGDLRYALAPPPPSGLTFDPVALMISGTPAEAMARDDCILTATDADGDAARLTFSLEVVETARNRDVELVLAGVGRTLATDVVDVLGGRFEAPPTDGAHVTLGGQVLRLTEGNVGDVDPGASQGTWQRVTGVVLDVARALGVNIGGEPALPQRDAVRVPGHDDDLRQARLGQSPVRIEPVSGKDLLARSAFEVPLSRTEAGRPTWTLWGRGAASGFTGQPDPGFRMDGTLASGYIGVDYRPTTSVLLGLALSHSIGTVAYDRTGETPQGGTVDVEVTSVLPYAHWQLRPGLGVWSLLGTGWGQMEITPTRAGGRLRPTDVTFFMGAGGGRQALATLHGLDLSAKADAFVVRTTSAGTGGVPAARGHAERVRVLLEGRTAWGDAASRVVPRLEVGGRWDRGSAERGVGVEVGGGLAYTHAPWGLSVEAQGRYLVAHEASTYDDWGTSVHMRVAPGTAGEGAYLTVSPVWGEATSGVERLWGNAAGLAGGGGARPGPARWAPDQWEGEVGYGVVLAGGRGLVTPYGGVAVTGPGTALYRLGGRLSLASSLTLRVEGERAEQVGNATHGITLRLDWQR